MVFGFGSSSAPKPANAPSAGGFDEGGLGGAPPPPGAGFGQQSGETEQVMAALQSQMADAYAQEFFQTVRDKCFEKCVTRPGSSLGRGESSCLTNCCDRYREALALVSAAVVKTLEHRQ